MFDFFKKHSTRLFVVVMILGVLFKNMILQGFCSGENAYTINMFFGISKTVPYMLLQSAVLMLFFAGIFLFRTARQIRIFALVTNIVMSLIIYIDTLYMRGFFGMPSIMMLLQEKSLESAGGYISTMMSVWDLFYLADYALILTFLLVSRIRKIELFPRKETKHPRHMRTWISMTAASVFILMVLPFFKVCNVAADAYTKIYDTENTVEQAAHFTSLGYHIIDIFNVLTWDSEYVLTDEDVSLIEKFYKWNDEKLPDNSYAGMFEGKNLIILQCESLENFIIGQSIDGQEITPNINKLLQHSYSFSGIHDQVKGGNSSDCDLMVMTSLLPVEKGSTFNFYTDTKVNSLSSIFKKYGYSASYFNSSSGSVWNYKEAVTKMMAYDRVVQEYTPDEFIGEYLSDKSILTQTYDYLQPIIAEDKPFYAQMVLCSGHIPFIIPEAEQKLALSEVMNSTVMGRYMQAMNYVDRQIGMFIDKLDADGVLEDTVIVLNGDHGGIHKYFPHVVDNLPAEAQRDWYGDATSYTVPLIIYSKDLEAGKRFDITGGQIDIMPSLLYLFGVDSADYSSTVLGRNLFNTNRNFAVNAEGVLFGELTPEDREIIDNMYNISNMIIRGNYFNLKDVSGTLNGASE